MTFSLEVSFCCLYVLPSSVLRAGFKTYDLQSRLSFRISGLVV